MKMFLGRMKPLLITLLALLAAVVVTLGAIQLRAWWSARSSGPNSNAATVPDQRKLDILTSLKSSSTPPVTQQSKILHTLSATSSQKISEQDKLKILQALQQK